MSHIPKRDARGVEKASERAALRNRTLPVRLCSVKIFASSFGKSVLVVFSLLRLGLREAPTDYSRAFVVATITPSIFHKDQLKALTIISPSLTVLTRFLD